MAATEAGAGHRSSPPGGPEEARWAGSPHPSPTSAGALASAVGAGQPAARRPAAAAAVLRPGVAGPSAVSTARHLAPGPCGPQRRSTRTPRLGRRAPPPRRQGGTGEAVARQTAGSTDWRGTARWPDQVAPMALLPLRLEGGNLSPSVLGPLAGGGTGAAVARLTAGATDRRSSAADRGRRAPPAAGAAAGGARRAVPRCPGACGPGPCRVPAAPRSGGTAGGKARERQPSRRPATASTSPDVPVTVPSLLGVASAFRWTGRSRSRPRRRGRPARARCPACRSPARAEGPRTCRARTPGPAGWTRAPLGAISPTRRDAVATSTGGRRSRPGRPCRHGWSTSPGAVVRPTSLPSPGGRSPAEDLRACGRWPFRAADDRSLRQPCRAELIFCVLGERFRRHPPAGHRRRSGWRAAVRRAAGAPGVTPAPSWPARSRPAPGRRWR